MQLEQPTYLLVLELLEALIPLANGEQYGWDLQDDELVRLGTHELCSLW